MQPPRNTSGATKPLPFARRYRRLYPLGAERGKGSSRCRTDLVDEVVRRLVVRVQEGPRLVAKLAGDEGGIVLRSRSIGERHDDAASRNEARRRFDEEAFADLVAAVGGAAADRIGGSRREGLVEDDQVESGGRRDSLEEVAHRDGELPDVWVLLEIPPRAGDRGLVHVERPHIGNALLLEGERQVSGAAAHVERAARSVLGADLRHVPSAPSEVRREHVLVDRDYETVHDHRVWLHLEESRELPVDGLCNRCHLPTADRRRSRCDEAWFGRSAPRSTNPPPCARRLRSDGISPDRQAGTSTWRRAPRCLQPPRDSPSRLRRRARGRPQLALRPPATRERVLRGRRFRTRHAGWACKRSTHDRRSYRPARWGRSRLSRSSVGRARASTRRS